MGGNRRRRRKGGGSRRTRRGWWGRSLRGSDAAAGAGESCVELKAAGHTKSSAWTAWRYISSPRPIALTPHTSRSTRLPAPESWNRRRQPQVGDRDRSKPYWVDRGVTDTAGTDQRNRTPLRRSPGLACATTWESKSNTCRPGSQRRSGPGSAAASPGSSVARRRNRARVRLQGRTTTKRPDIDASLALGATIEVEAGTGVPWPGSAVNALAPVSADSRSAAPRAERRSLGLSLHDGGCVTFLRLGHRDRDRSRRVDPEGRLSSASTTKVSRLCRRTRSSRFLPGIYAGIDARCWDRPARGHGPRATAVTSAHRRPDAADHAAAPAPSTSARSWSKGKRRCVRPASIIARQHDDPWCVRALVQRVSQAAVDVEGDAGRADRARDAGAARSRRRGHEARRTGWPRRSARCGSSTTPRGG